MLTTTITLLRKAGACSEGYRKLVRYLGGVQYYGEEAPIPLAMVLESNGLSDALWCLRAVPPEAEAQRDRLARLLACDYAEHVLSIFEAAYPEDKCPRQAIEVSRRFVRGEATTDEMAAAWAAAWAATEATAGAGTWTAARAAAWAAARAAARAAAGDAAGAAAWAAAWAAAGAAAWAAERTWQKERFIAMLNEKEA